MAANRGQRLATAVGFLSGLFICLGALRDVKVLWPPDTVWDALEHARRLELGGGIALMVLSLVLSLWRPMRASR